MFAAFCAGKYPKPTPMMVQTAKLTNMLHIGMEVGRPKFPHITNKTTQKGVVIVTLSNFKGLGKAS